MYQVDSPSPEGVGTVPVVLTFEVPAGFVELPRRTAQLADEYGRIIARSVPGVRVRPAQISTVRSGPPVTVTPRPVWSSGAMTPGWAASGYG